MSAVPLSAVPEVSDETSEPAFSRLRVPEPTELSPELRALVEQHHGENWIRALTLNGPTARRFASYFESLEDRYSIDALILSNWPLIEEAERFADLVLPLLNLDYTAPPLARTTAVEPHSVVRALAAE
jgi:hypothetical protein